MSTSTEHGVPDALSLSDIEKRFGDTTALRAANLRVRARTVHALLGENGAGKSTLMNIAFGMHRADAGRVAVGGQHRRFTSPADAIAAGLGMVHQHFMLVPAMSVAENVALGAGRSGLRLDLHAEAQRIRSIERSTGLRAAPEAIVGTLGVAAQQRVEIVKALARGARVLILDEPTAVLTPKESAELLAWVRRYVAEGNAAVLITHKLREALAHADDVTVLRRGETVHASGVHEVDERTLIEAMVGDDVAVTAPANARPSDISPGRVVLALENVTVRDERRVVRIRDVSLEVRSGEVVGIAGVEGAGQREVLRLLAGRAMPQSGRVVTPRSVAFVPEDRQRDALVLEMPLVENVLLRDAGARRGRIRWRTQEALTRALLERNEVRAGDPRLPASALSGGNQQRLVLARELGGSPEALVVESPTRGLDVRATAAIHERLRAERGRGAAVILYSSDLDELLAIADRVIVMHAGRVTTAERTREAIGRAMVGAA